MQNVFDVAQQLGQELSPRVTDFLVQRAYKGTVGGARDISAQRLQDLLRDDNVEPAKIVELLERLRRE